jgi:hypothetical protein
MENPFLRCVHTAQGCLQLSDVRAEGALICLNTSRSQQLFAMITDVLVNPMIGSDHDPAADYARYLWRGSLALN